MLPKSVNKFYRVFFGVVLFIILILPSVSHATGTSAPYDEQLGITFTQDYTSLAYNVTAIAQSSGDGYGPAYLLNGYSNTGYWYQIGLSYNWPPHGNGWQVNYEVFNPNGQSIYPQNGGSGTLNFNGPVNHGDKILLNLYFSGGNIVMLAKDLNTGSSASTSYSAEGASTFLGNPYATNTNGYFTGLMTEWYHSRPYYGGEQAVNYSVYGKSFTNSAWLWADEFYCTDQSCYQKQNIFWNSTTSPIEFSNNQSLYEFYSNGATELANSQMYISGNPISTNVTTITTTILNNYNQTTISYPTFANHTVINIQYNTTLPKFFTSSHIIDISGINQDENFYLTNSTKLDISGISNLLNITSSSLYNIALVDLSGVGNNITISNGNISIDLSGINNILILRNTKARILTSISGINNTIYLQNSTLIGGNKFGIGNKIISYQRGTQNFYNTTSQVTTTVISTQSTTIQYASKNTSTNTSTPITSYNQTSTGKSFGNILSTFINSLINTIMSLFGSQSSSFNQTITTSIQPVSTIPNSPNCPSIVNVGTDGTGSTSGSCTDFIVNIGTNGDYTNYGNACPSIVNIGTNGDYYNDVVGCNPTVNVGTNGDYHNINN
ncbi:MAG: hypothetical protein QXL94_05095 [Candidatus Parvarchaeum sp.]